jgi:hypothetical protein
VVTGHAFAAKSEIVNIERQFLAHP